MSVPGKSYKETADIKQLRKTMEDLMHEVEELKVKLTKLYRLYNYLI